MLNLVEPSSRISIVNLYSGEGYEMMFNPTTLPISVSTKYSEQNIVGLSYVPRQYTTTDNPTFTLDLFLTAGSEGSLQDISVSSGIRIPTRSLEDVQNVRNFLHSCLYPVSGTTVFHGGPPIVLLVWPGAISMKCTVESISDVVQQFTLNGSPARVSLQVSFREHRTEPLTSEDVRARGFNRGDV